MTHKDVVIKAESAELANDVVFTPEVVKVIGESTWVANGLASLVAVHCTDEAPPKFGSPPHPKTLRFHFTMPAEPEKVAGAMADVMNMVPALVDVVGRVQLTPGQREEAARARAEDVFASRFGAQHAWAAADRASARVSASGAS